LHIKKANGPNFPEIGEFNRNDVGNDQAGDEDGGDEGVIAISTHDE
jgi:hypothetical protein